MRKKILAAVAAVATVAAVAAPAGAITRGGTLDHDDHPYVGLMAAVDEDGERMWRCSGSMISPTVFVTAGHCVANPDNSPIAHALVWIDTDLEDPDPEFYGYRDEYEIDAGVIQDIGTARQGTAYPHPSYIDRAFFLYDLGVVVLAEPFVIGDGSPSNYAALPRQGRVDEFTSGRNKATSTVTAVGYGLQEIVAGPEGVGPDTPEDPFDPKLQADKTRYQADLKVSNSKGVAGLGSLFKFFDGSGSFIVSGDAKHGGTCFGDSGGPMLADGNVIVGVNSFGLNLNCAGIGGVYRIDQPDDLGFIGCVVGAIDPMTECYPQD